LNQFIRNLFSKTQICILALAKYFFLTIEVS
jgi:hypothetical protein